MVFTFFDPITALVIAGGAQGLMGGLGQMQELNSQADQIKAEEKAGDVQSARDIKDAEAETAGAFARRRALMAASGASGTAQSTALLDSVGATGGQNTGRLRQDWQIQRSSLRARRKNLKTQAALAPMKSLLPSAVGGAAQGYMMSGAAL